MDESSNLLANKRKSCNMLNVALRRKQPMRACRHRTTELNAGKLKRSVIPTSACSDTSIVNKALSLPTELMFNVLLLLPADVLYNVMRYMCLQWYKIIRDPNFIKTHLLRTNPGLFIRCHFNSPDAYYADMSTGAVTVKKINLRFSDEIWSSCDGLVLFSDLKDSTILHIVNPITKQQVTLPPFVQQSYRSYYFVLARACSTREYKVVGTYISTNDKILHCVILTVGKDLTWRKVDIKHISANQKTSLMISPLSVRGYIFWVVPYYPDFRVSLDVETEVLRDFPVPKPHIYTWDIFYAEMGNSIGCMFCYYNTLDFEILVLSDPKSGKWENLYKLDLEGKRHIINSSLISSGYSVPQKLDIQPVGWLKNGEVLVFSVFILPGTKYVAHNVVTGETYSFGINAKEYNPSCLVHVNSLVSLEL